MSSVATFHILALGVSILDKHEISVLLKEYCTRGFHLRSRNRIYLFDSSYFNWKLRGDGWVRGDWISYCVVYCVLSIESIHILRTAMEWRMKCSRFARPSFSHSSC